MCKQEISDFKTKKQVRVCEDFGLFFALISLISYLCIVLKSKNSNDN